MSCEDYREWIEEAAVGALDASRQARLNAHLAGCAHCRESLAAAERLLREIDRGLIASLDRQPSPEFAGRVRMRLAGENVRARPRAWWTAGAWVPASAAALAALVLAVWLVRQPPRPLRQPVSSVTPGASARNGAPREQAKVTPPRLSLTPAQPARAASRTPSARPHPRSTPPTGAPQFQVLVERGQWAAVVKLYNSVWAPEPGSGFANASRPSGPAPGPDAAEQAEDQLVLKPIEIKPLDVGLPDQGANPAEASSSAEDEQISRR
jgi:hypothetical protein